MKVYETKWCVCSWRFAEVVCREELHENKNICLFVVVCERGEKVVFEIKMKRVIYINKFGSLTHNHFSVHKS